MHLGLYNKLLALRHEYLDEVLYSAMHEAAGAAHLRPRVLLSTISFLQKLQGNLSSWSRQLKAKRQLLLVVDEFHQCSMEGLLAVLASFDCVVLAGDTEQAPPKDWLTVHEHRLAQAERERQYRHQPVLSEPGSSAAADEQEQVWGDNPFPDIRGGYRQPPTPLRKHLATEWLSDNVRRFDLSQTYRCGPSVVHCLQTMCPDTWTQLESARTADTQVFPFIFSALEDAQTTGSGAAEVTRSKTLFVHAAVAIALEVLVTQTPGNSTILCISFYTRLLDEFRSWLRDALKPILHWVSGVLRVAIVTGLDTTCETLERSGRLAFLNTQKAGGVTVSATILLAPRRQTTDQCWAGTALLHRGYRYVGLTRATERLYVFAEDLRPGLRVPMQQTDRRVGEIIKKHKLEGVERRVLDGPGPRGVREFEQQAEWASLLRWLQERQRAWVGNTHCITDASGPAPIFEAILRNVFPTVRADNRHWVSTFHWASGEYDTFASKRPRTTPPATSMVKAACFDRLRELVAGATTVAAPRPGRLPDLNLRYGRNPDHGAVPDLTITTLWQPAAVDAITVHVVSAKKVNIAIPLNWHLCRRLNPTTGMFADDCNFLAGVLARAAVRTFNTTNAAGLTQLTFEIRRHKRQQFLAEDTEFVVAQCHSDRPAFVGYVRGDEQQKHALYLYNAMGLPRQHEHQQVLLGRCADFAAAAALLRAATSSLGLSYRRGRVRFWAASTDDQRGAWDAACDAVGLESRDAERVTLRDQFPRDPPEALRALLSDAAQATTVRDLDPFLRLLA